LLKTRANDVRRRKALRRCETNEAPQYRRIMPQPLLAKPRGKPPVTLEAHTAHVVSEAQELLDARDGFAERKYRRVTNGNDLRAQLLRAARWHDEGKRHRIWQTACRKDWQEWKETGTTGGHLRTPPHLRHEFASLWQAARDGIDLTLPERAAIAAHHGKFSFHHEHRWLEDGKSRGEREGPFASLWKKFKGKKRQWRSSEPDLLRKVLMERYRIAGVRALLQLADTRASRREAEGANPPPEVGPFTYEFPHEKEDGTPSYRPVQKVVREHWDEQEMILRAPTGSGKTDAAMLWARHQIDADRADRLVIAMPTRFTSTALAVDMGENVGDTGLYHSSAWYARHHEAVEEGEIERGDARELHRMARLLMTPVTVSTIDHLLIALTGTREDHHTIFFNLMNACVVIDEADFYDPFVQANVQVLRQFDVPVLIMSATVPESAKALYEIDVLYDTLAEEKSPEEGNEADRTRCYIHDGGTAETPEDAESVLRQVLEQDAPQAAIVYANTVDRALAYHDWFCGHDVDPILYHSRFTEPHKKEREEKLINALGRKAWDPDQDGKPGGVAILTQIGEMSLNISAPLMVSDLCPYDRLVQRAGRLGRFEGMDPGHLHLIVPQKDDALYPAPYGEYSQENNEWKAGRALLETRDTMRYGAYSAQDFVEAVNALYPTPESASAGAEQNQKRLETLLRQNWLIVTPDAPDEDATETRGWRSRDIPEQRTVLTCAPPEHFDTFTQYRKFELEHGVDCAAWQIDQGKRLGRVEEIPVLPVGEDEVEGVLCSLVYSSSEGLILHKDRERPTRDCIL
jgi:CRISPR-associated endonuclease/helicase Cas3